MSRCSAPQRTIAHNWECPRLPIGSSPYPVAPAYDQASGTLLALVNSCAPPNQFSRVNFEGRRTRETCKMKSPLLISTIFLCAFAPTYLTRNVRAVETLCNRSPASRTLAPVPSFRQQRSMISSVMPLKVSSSMCMMCEHSTEDTPNPVPSVPAPSFPAPSFPAPSAPAPPKPAPTQIRASAQSTVEWTTIHAP